MISIHISLQSERLRTLADVVRKDSVNKLYQVCGEGERALEEELSLLENYALEIEEKVKKLVAKPPPIFFQRTVLLSLFSPLFTLFSSCQNLNDAEVASTKLQTMVEDFESGSPFFSHSETCAYLSYL